MQQRTTSLEKFHSNDCSITSPIAGALAIAFAITLLTNAIHAGADAW